MAEFDSEQVILCGWQDVKIQLLTIFELAENKFKRP